jgi:hypothetical protein
MNPSGRPENLRPQQFGNVNAATHGVYSRRALAPEARAIADSLMAAPYTIEIDRLGAEEIGALEVRRRELRRVWPFVRGRLYA